ncbi:exopolyphosphatase PRUNE1-like isoform X1 [Rhagoletis pomonella]|uniref:exopolyphosphatase PRUNE1-like isoform X1 n=1 Tax=Rhagoletis pomonella TaxID=28610 RepID=UPI001784C1CA|nr:exopolyphosphatase PRUNE1-like isoform X1 [Rhagoletis pomonella]
MLNFLKQTRKFVNSTEAICIVLGNESCDLDSAVCAIALAFHYQQESRNTKNFLPVLNIPRRDYPLKTEVRYLLSQQAINEEHLTFRDELQPEFLERSDLILVDHHVSPFAARCVEVFDHRALDDKAQLPTSCKTRIELVGSCATLIAEHILMSYTSATQEKLAEIEPVLTMLHSTIVLDTVNFSESANRATTKDVEICMRLEEFLEELPVDKVGTKRTQLFDSLVAARADVSSLTSLQLLRKDLKILTTNDAKLNIAIPGFPLLVQQFIEKEDAASAVQEFAKETNSAIVVLMGMLVKDGGVQRDLGCIDIGCSELCAAIRQKLLASTEPALCLQQYDNCNFLSGTFYKMVNIKATRKHVLPLIKQLLDQWQK